MKLKSLKISKPLIVVVSLSIIAVMVFIFSGLEAYAQFSSGQYKSFQTPLGQNLKLKVTSGTDTRLGTYTLEPVTPPAMYDFMVPDVCLDSSGNVTSEDPAKCTNKRNIRIGESQPYLLSDFAARSPGWNQPYQRVASFPVLYGSEIRIAQLRDFGRNSGITNGAFRDFDVSSDGYDILNAEGSYVSAIATRDPVTNKPNFMWLSPDCSAKDSWIFFPKNLTKGATSHTDAKLIGTYLPCSPNPNNYSLSLTVWNWYSDLIPYTSSKNLDTIQSWHHSGLNPSNTASNLHAMEVFRFTKEYGLTRWEGWLTEEGGKDQFGFTLDQLKKSSEDYTYSQICDAGAPLDRYGYMFYRWGCRDWSFVYPPDPKRGPVHAYSISLTKENASSHNLLQATESTQRADAGGGSLLGWKTLALSGGKLPSLKAGGDATTATNVPTADNPTPGNQYYVIKCTDACGSTNKRSMYMDVNPNDEILKYGTSKITVQAGGIIRGPAKALNSSMVVHMLDASGNVIESRVANMEKNSPSYTHKVTAITSVTTKTATTSPRLAIGWSGTKTYKTIPVGSKVMIGKNIYTTSINTTVGLIYLPVTTTGINLNDPVVYIEDPTGKVIYNDIGNTTATEIWQPVRFNFDWDFAAKPVAKMRLEFYIASPGEYHADEFFLAVLPQTQQASDQVIPPYVIEPGPIEIAPFDINFQMIMQSITNFFNKR